VSSAELDELVRDVDRLCAQREWDALVALRDRCRAAAELRGKQLWPAASLAEYRLALEAPARWAGGVLVEGAGQFALGPLTEVAASTHSWDELAPHVAPGPLRRVVAEERVLRGDNLTGADVEAAVPLVLQPWETSYALATYRPDKADFPTPALPRPSPAGPLPAPAPEATPDADEPRALAALAETWVRASNGRASAVGVRGDAPVAVATLLGSSAASAMPLRLAELSPGDAVALMAWVAASGGAYGRRRGGAAGRFDAWWAAGAVAGLDGGWRSADELGDAVHELRWYLWDVGEPDTGWWFRLAVEDPDEGLAWAVSAADAA
jgi:hypothetical protein